MAEAWELATRHQQRVEQIRLQSDLRRQDRIGSEIFDAEIEKLRGENERELVRGEMGRPRMHVLPGT